jgi:hypothetical protein
MLSPPLIQAAIISLATITANILVTHLQGTLQDFHPAGLNSQLNLFRLTRDIPENARANAAELLRESITGVE